MSHRAPLFASPRRRSAAATTTAIVIMLLVIPAAFAYSDPGGGGSAAPVAAAGAEVATHLVISEVMTGGLSASDEFIELYNPTAAELPVDGLELVYVTASGATVTRKATWGIDDPGIPPGAHLLVANESGAFSALADATYAAGLSATGGSVALRVAGDVTAIDAVGWGTAASTWLEGTPSAAPSAQHSIERLPGGSDGSTQDTDDNAADFVEREIPDPQNRAAPPVPGSQPTPTPGPTDSPIPTPILTSTPAPTPTLSPTPTPSQVSTIAAARALADGTEVTIEGVALTDSAFADGGGFVADGTGGIAILLSGGAFARGDLLRLTGTVDDRYAQRTIRSSADALVVLGTGEEPAASSASTGSIGEQREGELVEVAGAIQGSATVLSGARAFDLDDGSGAVRVYVGDATVLETAGWTSGVQIRLRGVVGQRDSSGSGTGGYRVMPRDQADLLDEGTPTATPSSSGSASPSASASASPSAQPLLTIAQARAAGKNERVRVRGVVTLPTGLMNPGSAAVQDGSGAIFLRPADEAGSLSVGQLVELDGTHSSWTGMESIRISVPPTVIASGPLPEPAARATGEVGEAEEALLIRVQGEVIGGPQRTSAENVIFDLDDGSGPLRVYISPRSGINMSLIARGAQLVITGVVLQETTGTQPLRGYRLWPTTASDVTVMAAVLPEIASGEAPTSSGGVLGVGATPDPDRTAAATVSARPQPVPQLTLAIPTRSAAVVVTAVPGKPAGPDGSPLPPAVPAALAAVALAGAGGLLARHGFGERLAALLPRPQTMDEPGETAPASDRATPWAATGELLPLSVVPRAEVGAEDRTAEHGRILPRT